MPTIPELVSQIVEVLNKSKDPEQVKRESIGPEQDLVVLFDIATKEVYSVERSQIGGGNNLLAGQGVRIDSDVIKLGNPDQTTEDININLGQSRNLRVQTLANIFLEMFSNTFASRLRFRHEAGNNTGVDLSGDSLGVGGNQGTMQFDFNGIQVNTGSPGTFRGIRYSGDFSANYVDDSLITKRDLDNAMTGTSTDLNSRPIARNNITEDVEPTSIEFPSPDDGDVANIFLSDGTTNIRETWERSAGAWVKVYSFEIPSSIFVDGFIRETSTDPVQGQAIHANLESVFKRQGYFLNATCRVVNNSNPLSSITFDTDVIIAQYGFGGVRQVFIRDTIDSFLTDTIFKNQGNIFRLKAVRIANSPNIPHPSNQIGDVYFSDLEINQGGVPAGYKTYTITSFTNIVQTNVNESYDLNFQLISPGNREDFVEVFVPTLNGPASPTFTSSDMQLSRRGKQIFLTGRIDGISGSVTSITLPNNADTYAFGEVGIIFNASNTNADRLRPYVADGSTSLLFGDEEGTQDNIDFTTNGILAFSISYFEE